MAPKSFHLQGLNGLRAIAAISVVISHALIAGPSWGLPSMHGGLKLASYGVTLFFVISGFLITYLLLLEVEKTNTVNVKAFYIRRVLRIWPLYYLYLLISLLVILFITRETLDGNLLFYIFLSANIPFILDASIPLLAHYWSLGVEEQFYLFWPWVIKKIKKLEAFLIFFIVTFWLLKILAWWYIKQTGNQLPFKLFDLTRFQCMAIGGLAALWAYRSNKIFKLLSLNRVSEIGAWVVLGAISIGYFPVSFLISHEVVAIISVVLIMNSSANRKVLVNIKGRFFDFLGNISFGVYVYHPLIILAITKLLAGKMMNASSVEKYIVLIGSVLVSNVIVAWFSYQKFERRFLTIKERYAIVTSRSSNKPEIK